MVAIKFSNRASYRLGTGQEVLKPEITWGRDRILRIRKSFINSPTMRVNANDSSGRWICTLNGIKANLGYGTTTPIKTTFNKKLVEWIWDAARNGSVPAYYYVGEDKIGEQIPAKEMKNFGNKDPEIIHDTFYFPGKPYMSHHKLGPDYLTGLELREEISFHQSTFSFESKITYAGVLVICVNKNTGRAIPNASKTLYWVKLN